MDIGELSRRTALPASTVEYYLRLELIPPGDHPDPAQANFSTLHEECLLMVKLLTRYGELSVADVSEFFELLCSPVSSSSPASSEPLSPADGSTFATTALKQRPLKTAAEVPEVVAAAIHSTLRKVPPSQRPQFEALTSTLDEQR